MAVGEDRRRASLRAAAVDAASLPADALLVLTVILRHRRTKRRPGSAVDVAELMRRVSHEELEAERRQILTGAVNEVRGFAEEHGMTVLDVSFLRRRVRLLAKVAEAERAFRTKLLGVDEDGERRHRPARKPQLPRPLRGLVHAVLGLDTRRPRFDRLRAHQVSGAGNGLCPSEVARLYGIATPGRGAGQSIALIEPGGGYDPEDVKAACRAMRVPFPQITDIEVGEGRNAPGVNPMADKEVALDLQVVAGIAPEARIFVYFTATGEEGLAKGVAEAVHDPIHRPNVIVVTWGEPEAFWREHESARNALDAALRDAIRLGITVVATAGDDLASERMNDGKLHVNYPASSPYVLGCGGTSITLNAAGDEIAAEVVWNDGRTRGTGGGISALYPVPDFQAGVPVPPSLNDGRPGRGVPDVAAAAAEMNGYRIVLHGSEVVSGGTSAVAPLWGAFVALLNEQRGVALGFVNPRLYASPELLNPIKSGDNIDLLSRRGYRARCDGGWNPCTGLGSPNGAAITAAFTAVA